MTVGSIGDKPAAPPGDILVTGAGGYIGAQAALALADAGHRVVAIDNCSAAGERGRAPLRGAAHFLRGDFADPAILSRALTGREVTAVLHFAASISVPESLARPLEYWQNNVAKTLAMIKFCVSRGVPRFVFSSSAAVYGEGAGQPLAESAPLAPINPYGASKAVGERILADLARAAGPRQISAVALRYFNVAGADPRGRAGDPKRGGGGLFKAALECAAGARPELAVCGTDFPTPDGSAVRDYIHVADIAAANLRALALLADAPRGTCEVFNCGLGQGFSVRQIVAAVKRVSGADFPVREAPARPGDPATLVADADKIKNALDFRPQFPDLDDLVQTAWEWELKMRRAAEAAAAADD